MKTLCGCLCNFIQTAFKIGNILNFKPKIPQ